MRTKIKTLKIVIVITIVATGVATGLIGAILGIYCADIILEVITFIR